jgi:predicted secreted hydrolase
MLGRITALLPLLFLLACREPEHLPQASLSVAGQLRTEGDRGYAKALKPREFRFPQDHGPHPDFRTEWWYYTGNLSTREGRRFGFQLTFFRSALAPSMPERASAWATRQAYLAHFTVSDIEGGRFHSFERWSRGALGLAGSQSEPFRAWVEDWSADGIPFRLHAEEDGIAIDLELQLGKPPVLQGERGLSRKSDEPGNASYYYSLTRMPASGTIGIGGERLAVSGLAWMDREWSTSSLGKDQMGWDWFALQLEDGRDLMLYQLRHRDGSADPTSNGTLVDSEGRTLPLKREDFELEVLKRWQSPRSGAAYPAAWRLRIPSAALDLRIEPLLPDQELDVSFRYWEGAVRIDGTSKGRGYVELTGYTDSP